MSILFIEEDWYLILFSLLELSSFIVTILGVIAILLAIHQFKREERRESENNKFIKKENSLKLLDEFSKNIIPNISHIEDKIITELKAISDDDLEELRKEPEMFNQIVTTMKFEFEIVRVFNELERLATFVRYEMVDESILYTPISTVTLNFIQSHDDVFILICKSAPFENLKFLKDKWNSQKRKEELEIEKSKIDEEIANIEKKIS